tara:strand:+ start:213 stop:434 length:222 start_codon:yes stop_codon:yes gene_type:complete
MEQVNNPDQFVRLDEIIGETPIAIEFGKGQQLVIYSSKMAALVTPTIERLISCHTSGRMAGWMPEQIQAASIN